MAQVKRSSDPAGPRARGRRGAGEHDEPEETTANTATEPKATAQGGQPHDERLQSAATELAPQLGAAAVAAVATAIIEMEMLPAVLIGAGAALLPKLLPDAGHALRPMLKSAVRAGYSAFSKAQQWAAEASEQIQDIVAEVRAEQRSSEENHGSPDHAATEAGRSGPQ